jgi:hypothetical protein
MRIINFYNSIHNSLGLTQQVKSTWSRIHPTEPGWYWFKDKDGKKEAVEVVVNEIHNSTFTVHTNMNEKREHEKEIIAYMSGDEIPYRFDDECYAEDLDGEWSERIEPPE